MPKHAIEPMILIVMGFLLCGCIDPGGVSCSRDEAPAFSDVDGQVTRLAAIAELGEPAETIERESSHVDFYEYHNFCAGVVLLIYPIPYIAGPSQMLTVEYDADGGFRLAQVWRDSDTVAEAIAAYDEHARQPGLEQARLQRLERDRLERHRDLERQRLRLERTDCRSPLAVATTIDGPVQYKLSYTCAKADKVEPDPLHWRWIYLAAHGQHGIAQRRMGILL